MWFAWSSRSSKRLPKFRFPLAYNHLSFDHLPTKKWGNGLLVECCHDDLNKYIWVLYCLLRLYGWMPLKMAGTCSVLDILDWCRYAQDASLVRVNLGSVLVQVNCGLQHSILMQANWGSQNSLVNWVWGSDTLSCKDISIVPRHFHFLLAFECKVNHLKFKRAVGETRRFINDSVPRVQDN